MDEKYIQELYNQLGGQSKFGAYNDFKEQISTNPEYQKAFHTQIGAKTLGDFNAFSGLVASKSPSPAQTQDFSGEYIGFKRTPVKQQTQPQAAPKYGSVPIPVETVPNPTPQIPYSGGKSIESIKPLASDNAQVVNSATTETKPTVQQAKQLIQQNENALAQSQKLPVQKRDKHGLIVDVPILDPAIQAQIDFQKKQDDLINGMDYDELSKVNSDGGEVGFIKDKVEKGAADIGKELPFTKEFDSYLKEGLFQMHKANPEGYEKQVENIIGSTKVRDYSFFMKTTAPIGNSPVISKEDQKQIDADFEGAFAKPIQIGINIAANKVSTEINSLKDKGVDKVYEQYSELMKKANSISDVLKTFQGQIDKAQLPPEEQKKYDALKQQQQQLGKQLTPLQTQYQQVVQQVEAIKASPQLDDLTKQTQINQIVGKYRDVITQYEAGKGKFDELQKIIDPYIAKQQSQLKAANTNEIDIFGSYNKKLGELNGVLAEI